MIFPHKLKKGSHIRVIAPSRSFKIISESTRAIAKERFEKIGITISYGAHSDEINDFTSSEVRSRLDDLHAAFADKSVDAILTAIGGFNSNQIIDKIDYNLIKNNPKILCGFSDITALLNAVSTQAGLVTYYGPHFSTFGMLHGVEHTVEYFKKCLMDDSKFDIVPSAQWRDDLWFMNQENVNFEMTGGYWVINQGINHLNTGTIAGGHLGTLQLLHGTKYMPDLKDKILFIETDGAASVHTFCRDLNSLIMQKDFHTIKALIIGRFQKDSQINREILSKVIKSFPELDSKPVLANADFGHTAPNLTIPLGGTAEINSTPSTPNIKIVTH